MGRMIPALTPRQLEIARLLHAGERPKRIALALGIRQKSVNQIIERAAARTDLPASIRPQVRLVLYISRSVARQDV